MTLQKTSLATLMATATMFVLTTTSAEAQYSSPYGNQSPFYQASQAISAMPMTQMGAGGCTTTCVPQVAQVCTPIRYRVENRPTTHVENRAVDRCVMVPQTATEKRRVKTTEVRPVTREREVTVYEPRTEHRVEERKRTVMVPVRKVHNQRYTEMRPVTETRQETYSVQVPVRVQRTVSRTEQRPTVKMVKQEYTVQVPQVETRRGTRSVFKPVAVQQQRTVYRDSGYWAEQPNQTVSTQISFQPTTTAALPVSGIGSATGGYVSGCCAPVDCCQTTCGSSRVWVPQRTSHVENYTAMQNTTVQEPYQYQVTTFKPETRERMVRVDSFQTVQVPEKVEEIRYRTVKKSRDVKVTKFVPEEKSREVQYTAYEPRTKVEKVRVTAYRTVPVKRKEKYTEMVPQVVEREIDVATTRMVERRYQENVAVTVQRNNPVMVTEVGTPTVTAAVPVGQYGPRTAFGQTPYGVNGQTVYGRFYGRPRTAAFPSPFAIPRTATARFGNGRYPANPYQRPRTLADSMITPFLRR